MTEQEWLACDDPVLMVRILTEPQFCQKPWFLGGKRGERKLRLWCAALLERSRIGQHIRTTIGPDAPLAHWTEADDPRPHFIDVQGLARKWAEPDDVEPAQQEKASLLRCLVGNPFRPVFGNPKQAVVSDGYGGLTTVRGYTCIRPEWLTTAVVNVAAAIYADRDWQALPVLADELERLGCDNADIIGHLRGPGPHACGCWVVDLLTGRQ